MKRLIAYTFVLLLGASLLLWGATLDLSITDNADDASDASDNWNAAAGSAYIGCGPGVCPAHGYYRFTTGASDMAGSTITTCTFNTRAGDSTGSAIKSNLYIVEAATHSVPTDDAGFDALSLTTAFAVWDDFTTTDGTRYDYPSCTTALQEAVDSQGNLTYIGVVVKDDGSAASNYTTFTQRDASPSWAPTLTVVYTPASGATRKLTLTTW